MTDEEEVTEEAGLSPEEERVFRLGGISYMHIPSRDEHQSGQFYRAVFGWNLRGDLEHPSFDDGTGHVIGTFVRHRLPAANDAGVQPFIFVDGIDAVLDSVAAHGGEVLSLPYQEGTVWIASIADPSGNGIGLWSTEKRA